MNLALICRYLEIKLKVKLKKP